MKLKKANKMLIKEARVKTKNLSKKEKANEAKTVIKEARIKNKNISKKEENEPSEKRLTK
jgi:hypothetical protein